MKNKKLPQACTISVFRKVCSIRFIFTHIYNRYILGKHVILDSEITNLIAYSAS